MKYLLLLFTFFSFWACSNSPENQESETTVVVDTNFVLDAVNYEQLKPILEKQDDILYVVNFWATWCGPCVEELPHFMEVNAEFRTNPKYKMILVTLDKGRDLDTKVKSFIEKNDMEVDVYLLDDVKKMNEWIPAIDESWSGSIPATVLYKNGQKLAFREQQLTKLALKQLITKHL